MSELIDTELETPCPSCGGRLMTIRDKDNSKMFLGVTKFIVYCLSCSFEEYANQYQERLNQV